MSPLWQSASRAITRPRGDRMTEQFRIRRAGDAGLLETVYDVWDANGVRLGYLEHRGRAWRAYGCTNEPLGGPQSNKRAALAQLTMTREAVDGHLF
jgi:hypothetical protein